MFILQPAVRVVVVLLVFAAIAAPGFAQFEGRVSSAAHRRAGGETRILKKKKPAADDAGTKQKKSQQKAQDDLKGAKQAIGSTGEQVKDARQKATEAARELDNVAKELEDAQAPDSPLGKAKARFDAAKKANLEAIERVLASPEYKAAQNKAAIDNGGRADAVADVRKQALAQDEQASQAASELSASRSEYNTLRNQLLRNDAGWKAANEQVQTSQKEANEAEAALRKARSDKSTAENKAKQEQAKADQAKQADLYKKQVDAQKAAAKQRQADQKRREQEQALRLLQRYGR